jgi:regulator of sigma E protease
VTVVGDATRIGISSLLTLVALISVNLAVLNVIPFPALDGGRVLFVLIEKIIRRPINRKVAEWINGIGFLLLILLLIVVTVSDVVKLF